MNYISLNKKRQVQIILDVFWQMPVFSSCSAMHVHAFFNKATTYVLSLHGQGLYIMHKRQLAIHLQGLQKHAYAFLSIVTSMQCKISFYVRNSISDESNLRNIRSQQIFLKLTQYQNNDGTIKHLVMYKLTLTLPVRYFHAVILPELHLQQQSDHFY